MCSLLAATSQFSILIGQNMQLAGCDFTWVALLSIPYTMDRVMQGTSRDQLTFVTGSITHELLINLRKYILNWLMICLIQAISPRGDDESVTEDDTEDDTLKKVSILNRPIHHKKKMATCWSYKQFFADLR